MKSFFSILLFVCGFTLCVYADNDVIITRDGTFLICKVDKITSDNIFYIDHSGHQSVPTTETYMVKRNKGDDFFFDEEGNQTTKPTKKVRNPGMVLYLRSGDYFQIYNLSMAKDYLKYQLKDKKKEPWHETRKHDVFLLQYPDGTTTLFERNKEEVVPEEEPVEIEKTDVEIAMENEGKYIAKNIVFTSGNADIQSDALTELQQIAEYMEKHPDVVIEVQGHTDNKGKKDVNDYISLKRAMAIVEKLVDIGCDESRLVAVGKGSSAPIASNNTEAGRAKNRRVEFHSKSIENESVSNNITQPTPAAPFTPSPQKKSLIASAPSLSASLPSSDGGKTLLAANVENVVFTPTPNLSPVEIETSINEKDPYTLYRKGSIAEYAFESDGKPAAYMGSVWYLQQIVEDEKIENGLLVAYIRGDFFNKKHAPMKIPEKFREIYFPVEIDTAGTYHFVHNPIKDGMVVTKRQGFGILIPGNLKTGSLLNSGRIHDVAQGGLGNKVIVDSEYKDWRVVGNERITTPAGVFDCVKLEGFLSFKDGITSVKPSKEYLSMWLARGIGIVKYEIYNTETKTDKPFIMYLNSIDIK